MSDTPLHGDAEILVELPIQSAVRSSIKLLEIVSFNVLHNCKIIINIIFYN